MASSKARAKSRPASGGNTRATRGNARNGARTRAAVLATPTSPSQAVAGQSADPAADSVPEPDELEQQQSAAPGDPAAPSEPSEPSGPPRWLHFVTFVLAIAGLAISSYETWAHFNGSHLFACKANGSENCTAVITSPESMLFGVIPVAILGLLFYLATVALMSPWGWRARRRAVHIARLASMAVGMGFVMYLIYAELYEIGSWCLYCTGVHIITFLLFCVTVFSAAIWGLGGASRADGRSA